MSTDPREFEHPIDGTGGTVPPQAIEAAARALYVEQNWHTVHAELDEDPAPKAEYKRLAGALWDKGGLGYENAKKYRYLATAALTAAAPFIAAQALRDAADAVASIDPEWESALFVNDRYVPMQEWLRERAATLEGKSE